jgi:hypothetical protein
LNSQKKLTSLTLTTLIKDITDKAQNKDKKAEKEVFYIVADLTQTRKGKAKAREISPKKATRITKRRESLVRTIKTQIHTISLTDALSQIRSFGVNKNKRQARHLYYIKRKS